MELDSMKVVEELRSSQSMLQELDLFIEGADTKVIWDFVMERSNLTSLRLTVCPEEEEVELTIPSKLRRRTSSLKKLNLVLGDCDLPWLSSMDWIGFKLEDIKLCGSHGPVGITDLDFTRILSTLRIYT